MIVGMRSGFIIFLMITLMFAGGYFYYVALAICPVPLEYRIGEIDERFAIDEVTARLVAAEAESVWEDATGRNLFTYVSDADFPINFMFDERQALLEAEDSFKDRLDATEEASDKIANTYNNLIAEYEALKMSHQEKKSAYEADLATYNAKVEKYNNEGGAPAAVFKELQQEQRDLAVQQRQINAMVAELNVMVERINSLGTQGNALVETYNQGVESYNQNFGQAREFTQGDYQGDEINIYTFETLDELKVVLAHEFGHALHLDHVDGKESVMYYQIGGQPDPLRLSEFDLDEFAGVCGDGWQPLMERIRISLGLVE